MNLLDKTQVLPETSQKTTCNTLSQLLSDMENLSVETVGVSAHTPWEKLCHHIDSRLISGFTPAYYASVMGTGISANIMYGFPFPAHWLRICGVVMAFISLTFFTVLLVLFVAALVKNPPLLTRIHRDTATAPFMGCFVMGFTSLVMFLNAVAGKSCATGVWVLWWICTVASFYTSFVTFFFSTIGKHRKNPNKLDASGISMLFLLPVVTLTVAASCGGQVSPNLDSVQLKIITMIISFIMWAIAVVLAFIVVSVNFWRLFVHKIPNSAQVLTMFLPIGFLGQGALAILLFGRNCANLLIDNKDSVASSKYISFLGETASAHSVATNNLFLILASSILVVAALNALILISFGYFFTFVALASTFSKMAPFAKKTNPALTYLAKRPNSLKNVFTGCLRFHRGFWSMTFPLGTMALSNNELYVLFNGLDVFRYVGAIYACILFTITISCLFGVVYRSIAIMVDVLTTRPEKSQV